MNFTTNLKPYNQLGSFKFWCQKVLPLVYDDSLSYYELLCKVVDYLNNVIENVDNLNDNINELLKTYEQLQNWVNHYFDTLDVQKEINNKLDEMASNGQLLNSLKPYFDTLKQTIDNNADNISLLNNRVNALESKTITPDTELNAIRYNLFGGIYDSPTLRIASMDNNILNLLEYEQMTCSWTNASVQIDGSVVSPSATTLCTDYIPYELEECYFVADGNLKFQFLLFDENRNIISTSNMNRDGHDRGIIKLIGRNEIITTLSKVAYVRINCKKLDGSDLTPNDAKDFSLIKLHKKPQLINKSIDTSGNYIESKTRLMFNEALYCGYNNLLKLNLPTGYSARLYWYNENKEYIEVSDIGLCYNAISVQTKYPYFNVLFINPTNTTFYQFDFKYELSITPIDIYLSATDIANDTCVSENSDVMCHASNTIVHNGVQYIGYYRSTENNVETINNTTIELMLAEKNLKDNSNTIHTKIFKSGMSIDGLTQSNTYAPYDPTLLYLNDLKYYFSAFDVNRGCLIGFVDKKVNKFTPINIIYNDNTYVCDNAGMSSLFIALNSSLGDYNFGHLSDFIIYENEYYTTLILNNNNARALLLKTSDGINFTLIEKINNTNHQTEINGCIRNGVFKYLARIGNSKTIYCEYDIINKTLGNEIFISNVGSKPCCISTFYRDYFLINTSTNRRSWCIFLMDNNKPKIIYNGYTLNSFEYFSAYYEANICYLSYTTDILYTSQIRDRGQINIHRFSII